MGQFDGKVVMDCTHSVHKPNQTEGITGGDAQMIETLAKAAVAVGVDGLFIETHPDPASASSDAKSMLKLDQLEGLLERCMAIRNVI